MSLINEMLRDLEARRAGELAKPDLQREIRPLPEPRRGIRRMLPWLASLLLVASGAGALAWWQGGGMADNAPPPPPNAGPAPVQAVPAPVQSPPASSPASPDLSQAAVSEALRLATSLEKPPAERELPVQAERVTAPAAPPSPAKAEVPPLKAKSAPLEAESAPPKPKVAEAPPAPASIEKTAVLASPRERADNDYRRAQALLAGGQAAGAHDALLAALKQDPTYVPARQALLRLLLESRRIDEAMALLQEGLDLQPSQIAWAMSLARLTVERGDAAGAERILARSAGSALGNAEYAGFHGHLLNRLGQFRAAAEQYQAAVRLAPGDGRWWFGLGQALEGDGHNAEARDAFRHALAAGNLNADLSALAEQKAR